MSLLQRLIEAGTPAALIAEVAKLEARADHDREIIEGRRAKDRARKSIPRNSTETSDSHGIPAEPPSLDKEIPPRPPKEINPIPHARDACARGMILPVGWKPEKLDRSTISGQIIASRGQEWAKRSLESFDNHWRAKTGRDATKRNWQATWANWVIEQDRRDGRNGQRNGSTIPGLGRTAAAAISVFGEPEQDLGGPEAETLRRVGPSASGSGTGGSDSARLPARIDIMPGAHGPNGNVSG